MKTGKTRVEFTFLAAVVLGDKIVSWAADVTTDGVDGSSANLTSRDSASEVAALEGFANWFSELLVGVDSGQPEAVSGSKVVASTSAVAFDEWRTSEGFQTRTWRTKTLSATLGTGTGVHDEGVTHPEGVPVGWAFWDFIILRVDSHDFRFGFADGASRDVFLEVLALDVLHSHWHTFTSGQPVRVIVSAGNVALFVQVAEHEWHWAKHSWTRTSRAKILTVSSFVGLGKEERVTVPEFGGTGWASWDSDFLGVSGKDETVWSSRWTLWTFTAVDTVFTFWTSWTLWTFWASATWSTWSTWTTWNTIFTVFTG